MHSFRLYGLLRFAASLLVAAVGMSACGDSTGPEDPGSPDPISFDFAENLQGWTGEGTGSADWREWCGDDRPEGCVKLDGTGDPGVPNAWIYQTLTLPAGAKTLLFDTAPHNRAGANSAYRVRLEANGVSTTLVDWTSTTADADEDRYEWDRVSVDISAFAGQQVTILLEGDDDGPGSNEQRYYDNVEIR